MTSTIASIINLLTLVCYILTIPLLVYGLLQGAVVRPGSHPNPYLAAIDDGMHAGVVS